MHYDWSQESSFNWFKPVCAQYSDLTVLFSVKKRHGQNKITILAIWLNIPKYKSFTQKIPKIIDPLTVIDKNLLIF